jgi:hypothetical protein
MNKQKYINNAFRAFRSLVTNEGRTARLHHLLTEFYKNPLPRPPQILSSHKFTLHHQIIKLTNRIKEIFITICAAAKNQGRIHHPTIPREN